MKDAGAPEQDVDAAVAALDTTAKGLPDPVTRYLLVNNGPAVVNEFLPGNLVGLTVTATGPIPDLTPLVRHTPEDFAYLVVEVGHHGGEVYLRFANGDEARITAADTVADFVVRYLTAWRVDRIFGYSGDGINPLLGALRRAGAPSFVQARHEEAAASMAVAHAKYTGGVGVVTANQGPGAVHLLNGLYDARMDSVRVVAVIGQQSQTVLGSAYQQEIDLLSLFKDVASEFRQQVSSPEQLPMVLHRAFKAALATRSPTVVILPHDVQQAPAPETPHEHGVVPSSPVWSLGCVPPRETDLRDAAAVLNAGRKVALLVGQGTAHAQQEVVAIADRLGAGITTSLLGKPFVDESLPHATGTMGHLGTTASAYLMDNCDTLLIIGSNDP